MKKLILILGSLLVISASAWAEKAKSDVSMQKEGTKVVIIITGSAARDLFDALEVEPSGELGMIQTITKKTERVECVMARAGDIPGEMSDPQFTCRITESAQ